MLKKETERISNSINEIEIHEMEILEKTASQIEKSRQTIMESKNQLLWSNSNRNQEKIINQYMERERTLLAQLDLSRANIKSAEGTRKLLQEHTLMLHDAQAKADALQKSYNEMLTRQHHAEATIDLQNGKIIEYKDRWMVSHAKNRQLQKKVNDFELTVPALELELKRKTTILNKYDEMLFDSTIRINDLKKDNQELKENVKHTKFLMEIISKMTNRCIKLKEQIIQILSKDKKLIYAYISNNDGGSGGGGDLNSLGNSSPDNKNGMDTSRNLLSSSSPYSSYDQKISGEVDSLIDFVNNLSTVARSYNSK